MRIQSSRFVTRTAVVLALAVAGCGSEEKSSAPVGTASSELSAVPPVWEPLGTAPETIVYVETKGHQMPLRWQQNPQLPDSCELLIEGDPRSLLKGPFAPITRYSNDMCIIYDETTPQLQRSLSVEVRHPDPPELQRTGHIPRNREEFWSAEDFGIQLVSGHTDPKALSEIDGLGDYAVWYTIHDGIALHAYWDEEFILAINVRGPEVERGLAWAKQVAQRAIEKTRELNKGKTQG